MILPWRCIAGGAIMLVIVVFVWWNQLTIHQLRQENITLRIGLADAAARAEAGMASAERIRRASEKSLQSVLKSLEEVRAARLKAEKKRKVLRNLPVTPDEDHLSAVISLAITCLRRPDICATKDSVGALELGVR